MKIVVYFSSNLGYSRDMCKGKPMTYFYMYLGCPSLIYCRSIFLFLSIRSSPNILIDVIIISSSNIEFAAIRIIKRALIPRVVAKGLVVAAIMAACNELNGLESVPSLCPGAIESTHIIVSSPHMKLFGPVGKVKGGIGGKVGPTTFWFKLFLTFVHRQSIF
ncbi:hypothetical protein [Bacillus sp. C1]